MDTDWETKPDELESYLLNFAGLGLKSQKKFEVTLVSV